MAEEHTIGIRIKADGSDLVALVGKSEQALDRLTEATRATGSASARAATEVSHLEGGLARTAESGSRVSRELEGMSRQSRGLSSMVAEWQQVLGVVAAAGAVTSGLKEAVTAYGTFEEGLIAVGKTADLEGSRLQNFGSRIDTLSHQMPVSTTELLKIAQAAGQLGVKGEENLLRFTNTVARMGSSTNLAGEEAATALARLLNVTGESMDSVETLGSVWVALGNNFATTEAEIARSANEVARATSVFGVSSAQASALAAAMASVGIQAELGGSSVGRAMRMMEGAVRQGGNELKALEQLTGKTGAQLKKLFAEDATAAFQVFLQGLQRVIAGGGSATTALEDLGLEGEEILKTLPTLAQRAEEVGRAMGIAGQETRNATALVTESEKAFKSFFSEMTLLKNSVLSVATAIGAELAPRLEILSQGARWVLNGGTPEKSPSPSGTPSATGSEPPEEMRLLNAASDWRQPTSLPTPIPRKRQTTPEDTPTTASRNSTRRGQSRESRDRDSDQGILDTLRREREELQLTDRERAISQASRQLSATATRQQRSEVERLAGAFYDEREALTAQTRAREEQQRVMEREQARSAAELAANQQIIDTLRREREELRMTDRERAISQASRQLSATATRQQRSEVERLAGALHDEKQALEELARSGGAGFEGFQKALMAYSDEVMNSSRNWEVAVTNAFRGMEEALVQFVTTGKADWKSLVESILADLARITIRESITGPLAKALGMSMGGGGSGFGDILEGVGSLASSIFHEGGMVGDPMARRQLPASLFVHAPRFHDGGLIGPDEIPIIAQRGERVLSRRENQAYEAGRNDPGKGGESGGGKVEIQIVNVANPEQIKRLVADTIAEKRDTVVNMVLNALDERNLVVRRF